jgi:hypothetical protein
VAIDTSLQGRDLYLLTTDEHGAPTYSRHRVWDPALFMAARKSEAAQINGRKASTLATAQQITLEQYTQRRNPS